VGLGVNIAVGRGVSVANRLKPADPWQEMTPKVNVRKKKINA
jgi:hypothetical protein